MSDGDAFNLKSNQGGAYQQIQGANSPPSQSSIDDGYLSEGGASFYARKIQSRIALEKQKTVEEQNRKLRQALPEVLGSNSESMSNQNNSQIYRVVGGRKHVPKSEMGMQTDHIKQPLQDHYDWKQVSSTLFTNHSELLRLLSFRLTSQILFCFAYKAATLVSFSGFFLTAAIACIACQLSLC